MSTPNDTPVTLDRSLPALILQRAGAAAAGFRPQRDHWILVAADGGSVTRAERAEGESVPPRVKGDEHAFLVAGTGQTAPARARIVKMTIDIQTADGAMNRDIAVPVENLDALFFGEGAIEKFVLPYYSAAFGVRYALKLSEKWSNDATIAAFCHTPWSEDCSTDEKGAHTRGSMTVV